MDHIRLLPPLAGGDAQPELPVRPNQTLHLTSSQYHLVCRYHPNQSIVQRLLSMAAVEHASTASVAITWEEFRSASATLSCKTWVRVEPIKEHPYVLYAYFLLESATYMQRGRFHRTLTRPVTLPTHSLHQRDQMPTLAETTPSRDRK